MQLLVSVRDASEAGTALAGGAAIIDAKEPGAGALGPVSAPLLRAIRATVPAEMPCSAALGDIDTTVAVRRALAPIDVPLTFVKLGFRGLLDPAQIQRLLTAAVELTTTLPGAPQVVAVAYADHLRMQSLEPVAFPALIHATGAAGLLVDTGTKGAGNLFEYQSVSDLAAIASELRRCGAFLALGGSLEAEQFPAAFATGASIVGVRGAACVGGRNGVIDEERVRQLSDGVRSFGDSGIALPVSLTP